MHAGAKVTCPNANAAVKSARTPEHDGCPLGNRASRLGYTSMAFSAMSASKPSATQTHWLESISKTELRAGLDCMHRLSLDDFELNPAMVPRSYGVKDDAE